MNVDRDRIERVVREVVREAESAEAQAAARVPRGEPRRTVAIGSDHAGYALKRALARYLDEELGLEVQDCGAFDDAPSDYPDFAVKVAQTVASGRADRGVMIDGAGIGSAIAANKIQGILAAVCHDVRTAVASREHLNANILTLGAAVVGSGLARQMVRVWLATGFAGGRHERRVAKILQLEDAWTEKSSSHG